MRRVGSAGHLGEQTVDRFTYFLSDNIPQGDVRAAIGVLDVLDVQRVPHHLFVKPRHIVRTLQRFAYQRLADVDDIPVRHWATINGDGDKRRRITFTPAFQTGIGADTDEQRILRSIRGIRDVRHPQIERINGDNFHRFR